MKPPDLGQDLWAEQEISEGEVHSLRLEEVLAQGTTGGQQYAIVRLATYGLALMIDGRLQSTQRDEHIYHESLIWPGLLLHPEVRSVLSFGGANGGIVRELLKLPTIENVTVVDVDEELFGICRRHLPHLHPPAPDYSDPRIELHFGPPLVLMDQLKRGFDYIVADLPDATEDNYALSLFEPEFYGRVRRLLNPSGLFVTQAGQAHPLACEFFARTLGTLSRELTYAVPYTVCVPSFGVPWGFVLASNDLDPSRWRLRELRSRMASLRIPSLRSYDAQTHAHMFQIPKALRSALNQAGYPVRGFCASDPEGDPARARIRFS